MTQFRSARSLVRDHGPSGLGTGAFLWERLTALALIPMGMVLLLQIIGMSGDGIALEEARAWLGSPLNGPLVVLFFAVAMLHAYLGSRVLLEDYVHTPGLKLLTITGLTFGTVLLALVATMAVLHVLFRL